MYGRLHKTVYSALVRKLFINRKKVACKTLVRISYLNKLFKNLQPKSFCYHCLEK